MFGLRCVKGLEDALAILEEHYERAESVRAEVGALDEEKTTLYCIKLFQ